ncbi:transcriptional regulator [Brevibacterium litoralis]|uniref:transcriptional regulator n=1 Tax=Brevibacterium litoralis TaxID=3138935 RepID=UPI0032EACEF0
MPHASPWPVPSADEYQRAVLRARSDLHTHVHIAAETPRPTDTRTLTVRPDVWASWRRSLESLRTDPAGPRAPEDVLDEDSLRDARLSHAFHQVLPLLRTRLVEPASDAGLLVALGDARGRLLWVEGTVPVRSRAESMGFLPGADWSEASMGTSAPALALATRRSTQVVGAEHFAEAVHPWSCSAVPVTDPFTGSTLGVIDITGGTDAVAPLVLPLLESTAREVHDELRRLAGDRVPGPGPRAVHVGGIGDRTGEDGRHPAQGASAADDRAPTDRLRRGSNQGASAAWLAVTGRRHPALVHGGGRSELSGRHAELLVLLQEHPSGVSAAELAEDLHGTAGADGTVRAELVRLRKALVGAGGQDGASVALASRPYRLEGHLDGDVHAVRRALAAGDVAAVLDVYVGHVLPDSEAPGIVRLRDRLHAHVREVVLDHGTWEQMWAFAQLPEAGEDERMLHEVLRAAPCDSPVRAEVVLRLEALEENAA